MAKYKFGLDRDVVEVTEVLGGVMMWMWLVFTTLHFVPATPIVGGVVMWWAVPFIVSAAVVMGIVVLNVVSVVDYMLLEKPSKD